MTFGPRKFLALFAAGAVLPALSAQTDPAPAPATQPDVTESMRWSAYFYDAGTGLRSGEVTVDWAVSRATLRMTDGGGQVFEASRVQSPRATGTARIVFPLGPRSTISRPDAAVKLGASDGQAIKVTAGGTEEIQRVQAPAPSASQELVMELNADEQGDLAGVWSYDADPVTLAPIESAGLSGPVTIDPDTLKTCVSGHAIWLHKPPMILYAGVIEDQEAIDRTGQAQFPGNARAPLREMGSGRAQRRPPPNPAERTLILLGKYFPPEDSEYAPKPTIVGDDGYIFQRLSSKADGPAAEEVKAGWQKVTAGMDPASLVAVKKLEMALFRVTLPRAHRAVTRDDGKRVVVADPGTNAVGGLKFIDWQGGRAQWLLQFGDNLAVLRFVRPHRVGMEILWEPTDVAFLPEEVAVELDTTLTLPISKFTVQLAIGDTRPPSLTAERIGGPDSQVYRTKPFTLGKPREGMIGLNAGDHLAAATDSSEIVFSGGAMTSVAAFNNPSEVPQAKGLAPTWTQLLVRSARANGLEVATPQLRDLASTPAKVFANFFLFSPEGKWYFAKISPERVKNDFQVGDHAAMLLLRDSFVAVLETRIAGLDEVKADDRLVEGFAHEARSTLVGSPQHPLGQLAAGELNGEKVTLRDTLNSAWVIDSFKGDALAADAWRLGAFRLAIEANQAAMREAAATTRGIKDDAIEDLLAMTARGFEPLARQLQQRLMRFDERSQRWVVDDVARDFVAGLPAKYEALIAVKEAKAKQTEFLVQVVATVAGIRALSGIEGFVGPLIAAACNGVPWAIDSFRQFNDVYDSKAEVRFAFAASTVLGDERYQKALEAEGSYWKTLATIAVTGALAVGPDTYAALKTYQAEMAVLRGRVLFEELGQGVVEFGNLPRAARRDMMAFAQDARASMLAGKSITPSQALAEGLWFSEKGLMKYASRPTEQALALAAEPMKAIAEARQIAAAGRVAEKDLVQLTATLRKEVSGAAAADAKALNAQIKNLETRQQILKESFARLEGDPANRTILSASELEWLSGRRVTPDDAVVDNILKYNDENWVRIKKAFEKDQFITPVQMHQFVTARTTRVNKMLQESMQAVEAKLSAGGARQTFGEKLEFSAFGSTNLTSDYDISVKGDGAELVVAEFNRRFRAAHGGLESGTVFDTNIYTDPVYKIYGRRDLTGKTLDLDNQDLDLLRQFIYDQMATRKYLHSAEEWAAHKQNLLGAADPKTQKLLSHVFEEAETANEVALKAIAAKLPPGRILEEMAEGAPDLIAAQNRAYEEVLENIHNWRVERQRLDRILTGKAEFPENAALLDKYPGWKKDLAEARRMAASKDVEGLKKLGDQWRDRMAYQLRKKQGEALYFASEAYQAEGTILHVVDEIQASGNKITVVKLMGAPRSSKIAQAGSLNSLLENRANMLKELSHYRKNGVITDGLKAATKGAKYFIRVLDAAHQGGLKLVGIAPRDLLELTVGIDAVRGSGDEVSAFLAKKGTTGEAFVARVMKASDQLAAEVVRHPDITSLADRLGPLVDEVGSASQATQHAVESNAPLPPAH